MVCFLRKVNPAAAKEAAAEIICRKTDTEVKNNGKKRKKTAGEIEEENSAPSFIAGCRDQRHGAYAGWHRSAEDYGARRW